MPKINKINVEVNYLKSLPNYENVRFTAGAEVIVPDSVQYQEAYNTGWNIVGKQIEEQLDLFSSNNQSKVKKGL